MASRDSKVSGILAALFGGLFMGGFGAWFSLGAMDLYKIEGILVANWIAACAGLIFFLSGLAMLISAGQMVFSTKTKAQTNVITPAEGGVGVLTSWGATIFVLLLIAMFWGVILTDAKMEGNMPMWMLIAIISIFTLVGIGLLIYTLWLTGSYLQFGNIKLTIDNYPPRVGDRLSAHLSMPGLEKLQTLDATLKCHLIRSSTISGTGNLGDAVNLFQQSMGAHWQDSKRIIVNRHHLGAYAQIEFKLPDNLPAANWFVNQTSSQVSSKMNTDGLCRWVLEIEKEISGPDLSRSYEIPIHPANKEEKTDDAIDDAASKMDQAEAIAKVTQSELEGGNDLTAITAKLTGLGISQLKINSGYRKLLVAGTSLHEDKLLAYLEAQQRQKRQLKLKTKQKVKRIKEIVLQQRKAKTDLSTSPLTELEFDDILHYTRYLFAIAPFIYFLYTLYIFFN